MYWLWTIIEKSLKFKFIAHLLNIYSSLFFLSERRQHMSRFRAIKGLFVWWKMAQKWGFLLKIYQFFFLSQQCFFLSNERKTVRNLTVVRPKFSLRGLTAVSFFWAVSLPNRPDLCWIVHFQKSHRTKTTQYMKRRVMN